MVIGFIEHLQILTTINDSAIANSPTYTTLQNALTILSLLCLHRVDG
jgi:hypothetical protein